MWKAVAPLLAPWCSEREVPTSAIFCLYGSSGSRVRWHSDDEDLFGSRGDSKLIVSMSLGISALFRWKPRPSPDSDADSCWLHLGDLLVTDGCCQDEYLHCTDPQVARGASEHHLSANQEPHVPVSFWCWGFVLLAHLRQVVVCFHQRGR